MPLKKPPKLKEPLWKEKDHSAQKKGQHHTVYSVNGDSYTGDWDDNKKNGKGTQFWKKSGAIYDGDWKDDMRNGFGMYSLPTKDGEYRKVYAGGWKNDKRHGHGTNYYSSKKYYEGEWLENMRSGWGRMYYEDRSVYEGEWLNDKRNGSGMLRLGDENRYEGEWKDDIKHGDGKFFFFNKGQVMVGTWCNDIAKCGIMEDFNRDTALNSTQYPLPKLELLNPDNVVNAAKNSIKGEM